MKGIIPESRKRLQKFLHLYGQRLTALKMPRWLSGSAGMGVAESVGVDFIQEVYATRVAANTFIPGTDVIIELGGEDAKILFLTNGLEVE